MEVKELHHLSSLLNEVHSSTVYPLGSFPDPSMSSFFLLPDKGSPSVTSSPDSQIKKAHQLLQFLFPKKPSSSMHDLPSNPAGSGMTSLPPPCLSSMLLAAAGLPPRLLLRSGSAQRCGRLTGLRFLPATGQAHPSERQLPVSQDSHHRDSACCSGWEFYPRLNMK